MCSKGVLKSVNCSRNIGSIHSGTWSVRANGELFVAAKRRGQPDLCFRAWWIKADPTDQAVMLTDLVISVGSLCHVTFGVGAIFLCSSCFPGWWKHRRYKMSFAFGDTKLLQRRNSQVREIAWAKLSQGERQETMLTDSVTSHNAFTVCRISWDSELKNVGQQGLLTFKICSENSVQGTLPPVLWNAGGQSASNRCNWQSQVLKMKWCLWSQAYRSLSLHLIYLISLDCSCQNFAVSGNFQFT